MNAPADTSLPPPAPPNPPPGASPPRPPTGAPPPGHGGWRPPRRGTAVGRRPSPLSAAGWLATTGAALLLAASIIVVASRWESIGPEVRFSGLVAALLAAHFAAEAGRRRFPVTSRALATLAATITAPLGVAAAATLNQPWPVCVVVGGVAALVTAELQARRWSSPALEAATVAGFAMAVTGVAALADVPVSLLGAAGAVGALALGAVRRAVALGVAVGLTPALVVLAEAGVGPGTLERIGAVGDGLRWSAPASAALAAIVIGVVAHRRSNLPLAIGAVAVATSGGITGLVAGDVGAVVWWCLPSGALLILEGLAAARGSVWRRLSTAAPLLAVPAAAAGLYAPITVGAARPLDHTIDPVWALPFALLATALLATAAGSTRRAGNPWLLAGNLLAAAGATLAAALAAGAPLLWAAALSLALWVAVSALTDWSTWELTSGVLAGWGMLAVVAASDPAVWAGVLLTGAFGVVLVVAVSFVDRADLGARSLVVAYATAATLASLTDRTDAVTFAFVAVLVLGVLLRPDRAPAPAVAASVLTVLSFTTGPIGWYHVAMVATVAVLFASAARRSIRSPWAHAAAATLVASGALALGVADHPAEIVAALLAVVGGAVPAIATLDERFLPTETAAWTAGGLALAVSLAADPLFVSLAAIVVGAQGVVAGSGRGFVVVRDVAAVVAGSGIVSLWWTTGTNALVIDAIAPYGATGSDVVLGVAGLALLGAGALARRAPRRPSTWLAYSPGLGLLATWLLSTQLEPDTQWATFGALAVGMGATAVGGLRRLGAPLVIGTATIAGTFLISAGPRLAEAPTWLWIAVGGATLLGLAALVERSERPLLSLGGDQRPSLLEDFCREFE